MALGRQRARQTEMLATWAELARSPGHVFCDKLQAVLLGPDFDGFVEGLSRRSVDRHLARIHPKLPPQMPEPLRVHCPAVLQQGAQLLEAGFGEEGPRPHPPRPDLDQPAIEQALDRRRDLRLVLVRASAPGAQEDAVRDARVLAEVAAELAPDQLALAQGEGG